MPVIYVKSPFLSLLVHILFPSMMDVDNSDSKEFSVHIKLYVYARLYMCEIADI